MTREIDCPSTSRRPLRRRRVQLSTSITAQHLDVAGARQRERAVNPAQRRLLNDDQRVGLAGFEPATSPQSGLAAVAASALVTALEVAADGGRSRDRPPIGCAQPIRAWSPIARQPPASLSSTTRAGGNALDTSSSPTGRQSE